MKVQGIGAHRSPGAYFRTSANGSFGSARKEITHPTSSMSNSWVGVMILGAMDIRVVNASLYILNVLKE